MTLIFFILFVVCVCVCVCVCWGGGGGGGRVRFFISASWEHYHADPEICNYTKLGKSKCCRQMHHTLPQIFSKQRQINPQIKDHNSVEDV